MKNGFSHHQRILQKGATISRFMDSTEVSNQTITHDGMKSIMSHHNVTQNIFKQVDTDDRIKKMCNSRQRLYKDYSIIEQNYDILNDLFQAAHVILIVQMAVLIAPTRFVSAAKIHPQKIRIILIFA